MKLLLKERGHKVSINIPQLLARLVGDIMDNIPVPSRSEADKRGALLNGIQVAGFWYPLTLCDVAIANPVNEDENIRPPTDMNVTTNQKYGFKENFDR